MEWAGDAGDLGDRRRLAWGKDQRQDRRYRRGHQAGQKASVCTLNGVLLLGTAGLSGA
jgi:hypothetical protein